MNLKLIAALFLGFVELSVQTPAVEKGNSNENVILVKERTEEEVQKFKDWKV